MEKITTRPMLEACAEDTILIHAIARRVCGIAIGADLLDISMDLTACHLNGNPLKLKALLEASANDLLHDAAGIKRNLDRETGSLTNFFSPRFSK